jgi:hypothetical protein
MIAETSKGDKTLTHADANTYGRQVQFQKLSTLPQWKGSGLSAVGTRMLVG